MVAGYPLAVPDSIRVLETPRMRPLPTAVHAVAEIQDTPPRPKIPIPGLGTTDQLMPSQDSITVPEPLRPTAVHTVAETQDTPERPLSDAGLGLGRTDQLVPSQDSIRVF